MTTLFKVSSGELVQVERKSLASEETLENWIAKDPSIIGLDVLILGRQVVTDFNARIDILAIDREGDITIIELKRDRTPREVVAQILDYASWIAGLTTKRIHEIAIHKLGRRLEDAFRERFDTPLPENLNDSHTMLIVASEFDASSKRIVEYLAQTHDVSINTAFFNVFEENGQQEVAAVYRDAAAERLADASWSDIDGVLLPLTFCELGIDHAGRLAEALRQQDLQPLLDFLRPAPAGIDAR